MDTAAMIFMGIIIAFVFANLFVERISSGLVCIIFILITALAPTIYNCCLEACGDFVEAKLILATPCWGEDPIHSSKKGFVDVHTYVDELVSENKFHVRSPIAHMWAITPNNTQGTNYKSYSHIDSNGYVAIKVVDEGSKFHNKIIVSNTYAYSDAENLIVYVNNRGSDFSLSRETIDSQTAGIMVIITCVMILGIYLGIFKSRAQRIQESLDDLRM